MFFGGLSIKKDEEVLKKNCPHVVVGTPGRILALVRNRSLNLRNVKHFVLDECDKMLEQLDMRRDVQEIFRLTPHEKQCMMFSATLSKEIRPVCRKFMQDVSRARWWPRPQWISFGPPGPGPRTGAQHPHCPHGTATLTGRGALSPLSRQTGS